MSKQPFPFVYVTDVRTRRTFNIEPTRRRSRKLRVSVMPAEGRELDVPIEWRKVPLDIRRGAKQWLFEVQ